MSVIEMFLTGKPAATIGRTFTDILMTISAILLAIWFALLAWWFVRQAEYRVSVTERTKHWKDEDQHPRWSRYAREKLQGSRTG
jgi:hypothetical protein